MPKQISDYKNGSDKANSLDFSYTILGLIKTFRQIQLQETSLVYAINLRKKIKNKKILKNNFAKSVRSMPYFQNLKSTLTSFVGTKSL